MRFKPFYKKIMLFVMAVGILCTSGCFRIFNTNSEVDEKETVARLLQEKYEEEFTVHDTWGDVGYSYIAVCSPVAEPGIVFEAIFYIGDEGKLYSDEYPQGIVAWELEQLLQPEVQKISEDAYIKAFVFYAETTFTRRVDVSIKSYLESIGPDAPESQEIMFQVYANNENINNIDYEKIYSVLKEISKSITPNSGAIGLYFITGEDIELCNEYFMKRSDIYPELSGILDKYKWYGTGIIAGEIKEPFEQFKSELDEIISGS